MLLNIQTSSSEMIPISDFQYLYELARCSKCQMFVVLKNTGKMYGASDDCCVIHEIEIPFLMNTDLIFRVDEIDKDIVYMYDKYFIPAQFPWVILPSCYWEMYQAGDINIVYDAVRSQNILIDKTTLAPIKQFQMYRSLPINDNLSKTFINQLDGLFKRRQFLLPPETIKDIHLNEKLQIAYNSKTAMGRILVSIPTSRGTIAFYFFKGIAPLAKADTMDLDIRFDMFRSNEFMLTFKPVKKKNPLKLNTYGVSFREVIHCMFMNIA